MTQKKSNAGQSDGQRGHLCRIFARKAPVHIKIVRTFGLSAAALIGGTYGVDLLPGRALSDAETDLYKDYFQDSVDYGKIKIHHSSFAGFVLDIYGAEAVSIGNRILARSALDDGPNSSGAPSFDQYVLMHEMAHMWQIQNCGRMGVVMAAAGQLLMGFAQGQERYDLYGYALDGQRDLTDYGVEQQASILADYYKLAESAHYKSADAEYQAAATRHYDQALKEFRRNPSYIAARCP